MRETFHTECLHNGSQNEIVKIFNWDNEHARQDELVSEPKMVRFEERSRGVKRSSEREIVSHRQVDWKGSSGSTQVVGAKIIIAIQENSMVSVRLGTLAPLVCVQTLDRGISVSKFKCRRRVWIDPSELELVVMSLQIAMSEDVMYKRIFEDWSQRGYPEFLSKGIVLGADTETAMMASPTRTVGAVARYLVADGHCIW